MRHQPTAIEQVLQQMPWGLFDRLVEKHRADERVRGFDSRDHFLTLLASALGGYQGLRRTAAALAPNGGPLRLMGGQPPARSTLSDAARNRPAALFVELLQHMLACVPQRRLRREVTQVVRLIDATQFNAGARAKAWLGLYRDQPAAKLHLVYDPRAERPVLFEITSARVNDISAAKDLLPIEPGATYVFDLGYYDFGWWAKLRAAGCNFVTRLKQNTRFRMTEERPVSGKGAVLSDRIGRLPERLAQSRRNPFDTPGREVVIRLDTGKRLRLFTNDLTSPADIIADLYKERWQIELFFKWVKQNLKITRFIGTSENALRSHIAVALIAYLLVHHNPVRQTTDRPACIILLVIAANLFVRRPLAELLNPAPQTKPPPSPQLMLLPCKT